MSDLIFYTNPQSRGRIVRWMLEECAVPYQCEIVPYGPAMKSAPYTDINPMGKVPAIRHKGRVVTETAAIVAYLAEVFPAAGLAPQPAERQDYYRWMFFAAGPMEAAISNQMLGFLVKPEQERMVGYGSFDLVVETLAKAVSAHTYIAGDKFTAADIYVGSHIGYGLQFKTLPERAEFRDYFTRISNRPARVRANEIDDALLPKPA
jgi:glutathione S-transferase